MHTVLLYSLIGRSCCRYALTHLHFAVSSWATECGTGHKCKWRHWCTIGSRCVSKIARGGASDVYCWSHRSLSRATSASHPAVASIWGGQVEATQASLKVTPVWTPNTIIKQHQNENKTLTTLRSRGFFGYRKVKIIDHYLDPIK